jgi:hypothetical protein
MERVLLAIGIPDEQILKSSFEALNEIAKEGYDYMLQYIEQIGGATINTINSNFSGPAMLAIEMWSTIADVEYQKIQA